MIGCPQTVTSWATQCRKWLPDPIGGVLWVGLAAAVSGPHVPFYACNRRTPMAYQIGTAGEQSGYEEDSAYWLFENIGNLHNLFYQGTYDLVRPVWEAFEEKLYASQEGVEDGAMRLYELDKDDEVAEFLTAYSNGVALQALEEGRKMLGKLFTRLALVNNPMTTRGYEDPRDWKDVSVLY